MSPIQTLTDAERYGLRIVVRCPACEKHAWLSPFKVPGDKRRNPWSLSFKCTDCGEAAGVRDLIARECEEEDRRRVEEARAAKV